jgi:hypothetical protein
MAESIALFRYDVVFGRQYAPRLAVVNAWECFAPRVLTWASRHRTDFVGQDSPRPVGQCHDRERV